MTKTAKKKGARISRFVTGIAGKKKKSGRHAWSVAKSKKAAHAYKIAGTTSDGVFIIRAKAKPKHFTSREIRKAINEVERGVSTKG